MSRLLTPIVSAAVAAAFLVASVAAQQTPGAAGKKPSTQDQASGWIELFDGKSLDAFRGYKKADMSGTRWRVENGTLTLPPATGTDTKGALDIISKETFDRFELTWEWRASPGANSGVKYFVLEDMDAAIGHEYQIIDDERHADAKIGAKRQTAALYDVLAASNRPTKSAGEWNSSRVVVSREGIDDYVEHSLNGTAVLKYKLNSDGLRKAIAESKFKNVERFGKLQNGHILLQDHGDQVWYRNIRIRRLPATSTEAQRRQ